MDSGRLVRDMKYRILVIGGLTCWISALEEEMLAIGRGRIADRFDLIVGTLSGSAIACGLALGIKASVISDCFRENDGGFFDTLVKFAYNPKPFEILRDMLGTYKFGDVRTKLMSVVYDAAAQCMVAYKSWNPADASIPMCSICCEPEEVEAFVLMSQPSTCALVEAARLESSDGSEQSRANPGDIILASFECESDQDACDPEMQQWNFERDIPDKSAKEMIRNLAEIL